jgi:hypothetical protein
MELEGPHWSPLAVKIRELCKAIHCMKLSILQHEVQQ